MSELLENANLGADIKMKMVYNLYESPLGIIRLLAVSQGLLRLEFEDEKKSLIFDRAKRDADYFKPWTKQLDDYFAGKLKEFSIPLVMVGSEFQMRVWKALCDIPYGETRSYGEIARVVGNSLASRAVGAANRRNPLGIIVPCHRVIGSSGKLIGYGGGLWRKEALLDMEKRHLAITPKPISAKAS